MPSETCREQSVHARPILLTHSLREPATPEKCAHIDPVRPTLQVQCQFGRGKPPSLQDVTTLCKRGLRTVVIDGELFAPPLDYPSVTWLAFLRDLASCGVEVLWTCAEDSVVPEAVFRHLPPPQGRSRDFRFGTFYWRFGPDFVTIRDSRDEGVRLFILDDTDSRETFLRSVDGVERKSVAKEAAERLLKEGLIAELGDWLLALPYRMRHWPVPFRAV